MKRSLTASEYRALNSKRKIVAKGLRKKALGVKKEYKPDKREVNYDEQ